MMNESRYVLIGGGVSSLVAASKLVEDHPKAEIIILEQNNEIGGLYRSIDYGEFGLFDFGMHLFYETCVTDIDRILNSFLPEKDWIKLSGNQKDIAGIYFQGKIQTHSPYLDLRGIEKTLLKNIIDEFFDNVKNKIPLDQSNAYTFFCTRFGKTVTEEYFSPIFKKLYRTPLEQLDILSTKLTGNDRIILFDVQQMLDLMKDDELRSKLAYPEQDSLPGFARPNSQRALYPRKFGMRNFFDSAAAKLREQGVKILTQAQVQSIELENEKISSITYLHNSVTTSINNITKIFWNAGLPMLAKMLGLPIGKPPTLRDAAYVNIIFDRSVDMGKLYYIYCYDKSFMTFRVTNYEAYCPSAKRESGYPVCVEFWPENKMTSEDIFQKTIDELKIMKIISNDHVVNFYKVENTKGGFPIPTIYNIESIDQIRDNIKSKNLKNLVAIGGMAEKNCFFIPDVLRDTFLKIQ